MATKLKPTDVVLEIGTGTGLLTHALCDARTTRLGTSTFPSRMGDRIDSYVIAASPLRGALDGRRQHEMPPSMTSVWPVM